MQPVLISGQTNHLNRRKVSRGSSHPCVEEMGAKAVVKGIAKLSTEFAILSLVEIRLNEFNSTESHVPDEYVSVGTS